MSIAFTTDNIDRLQAVELDPPRGWEITFRSANEALHHQLYINGVLADFTDTTDQRSFTVDAARFPRELAVAAVDRDNRAVDMSDRLDPEVQQPPWVYRASVVRSPNQQGGSRIVILGDHATGQIDPLALAERKLRPEWSPRWGFGDDPFALGGFGYDAASAPGLGKGAFGAGAFGQDAEVLVISAALAEEGTHRVLLRVISQSGTYADGPVENISACPPPAPPSSLQATDYDAQTNTLTLQIQ